MKLVHANAQEQRTVRKEPEKAPEISEKSSPRVDAEALKSEMDAILEDIDAVLEENAQEFVNSYIQKGGE